MNERITVLTEELKKAAESYYNSGTELMSNKEYDAKFDELKKLEEAEGITDGFTSRVGSSANGPLRKVTHEFEALSLGKTKDIDEVVSTHKKLGKPEDETFVCLSWKADGSTLQLTYEDGKLVLAATRGDGRVGQDITENARYIEGIPQTIGYKGKLTVRGEALMTYAEFDRLNTDGQYANPRNLANATITALDKEIVKSRKTVFKAFELVNAEPYSYKSKLGEAHFVDLDWLNSFSGRLDYLNNLLGFIVIPHVRVSVSDLAEEIKKWSEPDFINATGFPVDGLVIAGDDCEFTRTLKGTGHHPHLAKGMAFKWQDETAETILREIEWSPSRTGLLNPVAVFDTVELCGTKVSRASVHNVSYVDDMKLKIGDRITVYKANMIIPQIDENLDADKEGTSPTADVCCPCCKTPAEIRFNYESGTKVMYCPNEECPEKMLGRMEHFVSKHGVNIEGLSKKTLKTLMDSGLIRTIPDLFGLSMHEKEISGLKGFGPKAADNLINAVEKARTSCDISHFLYSLGIPNFGRGQIKLLKEYIDSHDEVRGKAPDYFSVIDNMIDKGFDLTGIEGIGEILACNFARYWKENRNYIRSLIDIFDEFEFIPVTSEKNESSGIAGKSFCITGSLNTFANREECVAFIERNGGKFVSGVSSKTDYLVNNDIESTSGKNKKAKELNIPIITEEQLVKMV